MHHARELAVIFKECKKMKYKLVLLFLILIISSSVYGYINIFIWSPEHAESDPEKSDHVIFVRVLEKKIVEEKVERIGDKSSKDKEVVRPQVVKLRVSKTLKGTFKKGDSFLFLIGADYYSLKDKMFNPMDHIEDISPLDWVRQQNTQRGFDFQVGESYLIFLVESKPKSKYRKYFLRSGPFSIGRIKYADDRKTLLIDFGSKENHMELQKFLDKIKDKL